MISVTDAKNIIHQTVRSLPPVMLSLADAAGLVLAENVVAATDLPQFNQAAMDGYAFFFDDMLASNQLLVCGEVAAGSHQPVALEKGTAMRIFTGAPVPTGADVVVMQEKVKLNAGHIIIEDEQLLKGRNVRTIGSAIQAGNTILQKGTILSPGAIGLIASLGIARVPVFPPPKITLLITGNELIAPGNSAAYGQVHEANSYALQAALKKLGVHDVSVKFVPDNMEEVQWAMAQALIHCDLLLITGGVSVGKYDFVVAAAASVGVTSLFHKVAQKPGKPLFFGARQGKPVFGLPGNPGAVLTCFYLYMAPAIKRMMQHPPEPPTCTMPLGAPIHKREGITYFLKGRTEGNTVVPLGNCESVHQSSFAFADCLIELDAATTFVEKETPVPVHYF